MIISFFRMELVDDKLDFVEEKNFAERSIYHFHAYKQGCYFYLVDYYFSIHCYFRIFLCALIYSIKSLCPSYFQISMMEEPNFGIEVCEGFVKHQCVLIRSSSGNKSTSSPNDGAQNQELYEWRRFALQIHYSIDFVSY